MATFTNHSSLIQTGNLSFLIIGAPTNNLETYIKELKQNNVVALVRACDCRYDTSPFIKDGIEVYDMFFQDGNPPTNNIIERWLKLCNSTFKKKANEKTIAVHCVAGLGRAPVLVAIALIEQGIDPLEAISLIRSKRRGAINTHQLHYLENQYKKVHRHKAKCIIL
jgi:protein tyrosine phosphatase type 4A